MTRTITVGLDGSPASLAAADWAAHEAQLRNLPLRLVTEWEWQAPAFAPATGLGVPVPPSDLQRASAQHLLAQARSRVAEAGPEVPIATDEIPGLPVKALLKAAEEAELLVLGSRGLSRTAGYLLGSVSQAVLASCERPVVLVRAAEHGVEEGAPEPSAREVTAAFGHRDVVLGLDLHKPDDAVIDFAFDAASQRAAPCGSFTAGRRPTTTAAS